jgi:phospholipase C
MIEIKRSKLMRLFKIGHMALVLSLVLATIGLKPALADGNIQRVNHVIVLMQENHSFDNYFGALAYAPGSPYHNGNGACDKRDHACVDGLSCTVDGSGKVTCSNSNLDQDGSTVVAFHDANRCVAPDLDHSWFYTHLELNFLNPNRTLMGLNDGFVRVNDLTEQIDNGTESATEDETMGFYNQDDLPLHYGLA